MSAQFWLIIALVVAAVALVRHLAARRSSGTGALPPGFRARTLHLQRPSRPVDLDALPAVLAEQAMRAARRVPAGRAIAPFYQVRCGESLFAAAEPHVAALSTRFVHLLGTLVGGSALLTPRVRFAVDEGLAPEDFRLDAAAPGTSPRRRGSATVVHVPIWSPRHPSAGRSTPSATKPLLSSWRLRMADGRHHVLPMTGETLIGADPCCDVVLDDPHVSARHARIAVDQERLVLRDGTVEQRGEGPERLRPSVNGTYLRGHMISTVTLDPDDSPVELRIGPYSTIRIRYDDPGVTRPISGARTVYIDHGSRAGRPDAVPPPDACRSR